MPPKTEGARGVCKRQALTSRDVDGCNLVYACTERQGCLAIAVQANTLCCIAQQKADTLLHHNATYLWIAPKVQQTRASAALHFLQQCGDHQHDKAEECSGAY